ncbi:MAG: CAP domain-containing protein [Pirellulales bacterium]
MRRRHLAALVGCAVLIGSSTLAAAGPTRPVANRPEAAKPERKPAGPTKAQRRDMTRGLRDFREARTAAKRLEATRLVLRAGPDGAKALAELIEHELRKPLERYRAQFSQAASGVLRARGVDLQEIAQLRMGVVARARQQNLTEDAIRGQSDPALARLNQLLGIDRNQVLQADRELAKLRAELLAFAPSWDACQAAMQRGAGSLSGGSFEEYLVAEEQMSAQFAMPFPPEAHLAMSANARASAMLDSEEARGIAALNLTRLTLGLNPLLIDPALCSAARDHSNDMVTSNFFSHESPLPGKRTIRDRATRFGTTGDGENIAHGPKSGQDAIRMWWYSPGHHKNMLGDYRRVGLGRANSHWTMMFGR